MEHLTSAQIRSALKNRDSLIQFMESGLGYRTNLVSYNAIDLGIAPYLARRVNGWWLASHYPGLSPFQIHVAHVSELTFNYCASAMQSFYNRHPGYFLFIFTKDYSYVLFMTTEWSLERIPKPGSAVWPLLPKPYPRFLLVDRDHPTENDATVLTSLRFHQSVTNPADIHARILAAIKSVDRWEPIPEWFLPYWYRLRDPAQLSEALNDTKEFVSRAEECLMDCLATETIARVDEACEYLDRVIELDEVDTLLPEEEQGRLLYALERIGGAKDFFNSGERDEGMLALHDALFHVNYILNAI